MTQDNSTNSNNTAQSRDDEILEELKISRSKIQENDWQDQDRGKDVKKGLTKEVVEKISEMKNEPQYMREFRLKAFEVFQKLKMPKFGPDLSGFDFDDFKYFVRAVDQQTQDWSELPEDIRETYDKLGLPEAEKKMLVSGMAAQYESEVVYQNMQETWAKQGIIFTDMDSAVKDYPELVQEYFATVVPVNDNKFAALNSACWSGGSFVYVPKGVKVEVPLQAYFRINTQNLGQFERTLIIIEDDASCEYIEGCTAPIYNTNSLHSGVIEIIVKNNATMRYITIQNWSKNIYNLVTQRSRVYDNASMSWVDGNLGSKITMKYPCCELIGERAKGEVLSIAFADSNQTQDAGAKMIHQGKHTSSQIISKSISLNGGLSSYRGLVSVSNQADHSKSNVLCDALLLDNYSETDTYPHNIIDNDEVSMGHEASVSKVNEEQIFYLMSRGISENDAKALIVRGFIEPVAKYFPMEYALELNRLIELQMEKSIG